MAEMESTVVWRRTIDHGAHTARRKKFLMWFVAPAIAVILIGLLVGGVGALLGLSIFLGLFGLLVFAWVEAIGIGLRQNPEIVLTDGQLVLGRRSVVVAEVERWSTLMGTQTSVSSSGTTSIPAGRAVFRSAVFVDGQRLTRPDGGPAYGLEQFTWPRMPADQLEGVRQALAPHLPVPWVDPDHIEG